MKPETVLVGLAVATVLATVGVLAAAPGAVQPPADEPPADPGDGRLTDLSIAVGNVSGGTATLAVTPYVEHRGNPAPNVTVFLRAVDAESGLVADTNRLELGELTGGTEANATGTLSVPRAGGYRIEAVVYRDGKRLDTGSRSVSGVESLTPANARTPVQFHEFEGDLPVIEYSIDSVVDNSTTLLVTTYLSNVGDDPAENLRFVLKARQNGSNVVADRTTVDVGRVEPGETVTPTAQLTVPDGYNYYLDAILWKGQTVVDTQRSVANLAPDGGLRVENESQSDGFRSGDFDRGNGGPNQPRNPTEEQSAGGQPGLGVPVALAALLTTAIAVRRVHR